MYQQPGSAVRVGDVLAAKYRVDRVLGEGGMGMVVAAFHLQLEQLVALKFIRSELPLRSEVVDRFEREARIAVRLKSEHVARIIDVGRLEDSAPYIVMEYLEGHDLARVIEQRGTIPVSTACDYVIQACDAISEAHGLGIVHRDLKPGNLFLASRSHGQQIIKVLDFGISKIQGPGVDFSATSTQAVMGSPGYMSPEQMRSTKNVDGRTDIWSLGVILYELVSGRVPFHADTFSALCVKIAVDLHPPLAALPAKLPKGFDAVINRALEKNPARRFESAAEFAQALAPYAGAVARDKAMRLILPAPLAVARGAHLVKLGPDANTVDAASGQLHNTGPRRLNRVRALSATGVGLVGVAAVCVAFARWSGSAGRSSTDDQRVRDVGPRPSSPPTPVDAAVDATLVTAAADAQPALTVPASAAGKPPAPTPPALPAATPPTGQAASPGDVHATPPLIGPGKPKPRPQQPELPTRPE